MNDDTPSPPNPHPAPGHGPDPDDSGPHTQRVQYNQVAARIPDGVGRGVFSNGVLVMQGSHEAVLDFVQTLTRPHRVAARVILPHSVLGGYLDALRKNLKKYEQRFGPLPGDGEADIAAPSDAEGGPGAVKSDADGESGATDSGSVSGGAEAPAGSGQVSGPPLESLSGPSEFEERAVRRQPPTPEEIYDQLKLPDDVLVGRYANAVMITHSQGEFCFDFLLRVYPKAVVTTRVYLSVFQSVKLERTLTHSWGQLQQKMRDARRRQHGEGPGPGTGPASPPPNDPFHPRDDDDTGLV